MPKYLLSIEFESIREHAILFRSMCESSAKALVATNGLKGLGPIEIVALQDNIESQNPSANTASTKLLDEMEQFAVMCQRAGNGKDARYVRSWVKQLRVLL